MIYLVLAVIAVILLLSVALAIAVKVAVVRGEAKKELNNALAASLEEYVKLQKFIIKKEEAQRHADEKKETLHTGDPDADFNNSIGVLHGAAKDRGG